MGSTSILRKGDGEAGPTETGYFNVVVCDPANLIAPENTFDSYSCPPSEDPGEPGDHVIVVTEFNHPVLMPILSSIWPQLRLTSMREAIAETYFVPPAIGTPPPSTSHPLQGRQIPPDRQIHPHL
ncbi:MAG: hypothetical protein A2Z14_15880 [Chloroflexi bacterium RBG_16_48_8]|nr:MAG: hypothetical protein A2Z14_15880 [Chloroflexi bacterium RBG_16_48_8]